MRVLARKYIICKQILFASIFATIFATILQLFCNYFATSGLLVVPAPALERPTQANMIQASFWFAVQAGSHSDSRPASQQQVILYLFYHTDLGCLFTWTDSIMSLSMYNICSDAIILFCVSLPYHVSCFCSVSDCLCLFFHIPTHFMIAMAPSVWHHDREQMEVEEEE